MPDEQQDKKPEFEVIRRAPPPESSSASPAVLGLIALALIGFGIFFAMRSGGGEEDTPGGGVTPSPSASLAPDEPAPDFVWEQIDFYVDQGNLNAALDAVDEALQDYPNARKLKAKQASLRKELGGGDSGPSRSASALTRDAKEKMDSADFDSALDMIDEALESEPDDAELYFLRGRCLGELGQKLEAISALQDAKDLGYDEGQANQLIERYR